MPEREYTIWLDTENKVRVFFKTNKKSIHHFVVQYYALIDNQWVTLMRIDNSHGYAHKHTYYLHYGEYKVKLNKDNSTVLNDAIKYVKMNYKSIKENYLNS